MSELKNTGHNQTCSNEDFIDQAESWNIEGLSVYLYLPLVDYGVFYRMDMEEIAHI